MATLAKIDPVRLEITSIPGIQGGAPCIGGTRLPAETVLVHINGGYSEAEFLSAWSHMPVGIYDLVIEWALANGLDVKLPDRRVRDAGA